MANLTNEQKTALIHVIEGYEYWIDRLDDLDTNDFWYEFYDADDENKDVYVGYVGADNDDDGTLFVEWWTNKAIEAINICRAMIGENQND